jgi:hypothetical protein
MNANSMQLNQWSHKVPVCMPWAQTQQTLQTMPTNTTNISDNRSVMQFTANQLINSDQSGEVLCPDPCTSQTATRWELLNNISTGKLSSNQHLKRRNDSSDEELEDDFKRPIKQYITEDKVSAIFDKMHITHNQLNEEKPECDQQFENNETIDLFNNEFDKKRKIVLANELQNVINSEDMTQKLIKSEFDKLSKAVVVWRPKNLIIPIGIVPKCNEDNEEEEAESDSSNKNLFENSANNTNYSDIEFTPIDDFLENDYEMELCP